jgi:predicted secreted protein
MTTYAGQNALLKIEDTPGAGTYTTVAQLQTVDISISNDEPTAALAMQTWQQHGPDAGGQRTVTVSGSGFASDHATFATLNDYTNNQATAKARLYLSASEYYQGDARITSLNIGGGHSGALSLSVSLTLSNTIQVRPYTQLGSALTASDAGANDNLGEGVAISRNGLVMAAGAREWDGGGGTDQGKVYVYDWNGSGWTERTTLTAADPGPVDWYGRALALNLDGSVLVVGADWWDGGAGFDQGGVYTYDWNGSAFVQRGSVLTASDAGAGDSFGVRVALSSDGSILAVGAPIYDDTYTDEGACYIFERSGDAWTERQIIAHPEPQDTAWFGHGVAISPCGTVLAVSALLQAEGGSQRGKVYLFKRQGDGTFVNTDSATAPTPTNSDIWGKGPAMSDQLLFCNGSVTGTTIFRYSTDGNILATIGTMNRVNRFPAISSDSSMLIEGAPLDDTAATDAGAVYTFYG